MKYCASEAPDDMKNLLIVDGYNVIFGWEKLNKLSKDSLEHSRLQLVDTLLNYGRLNGYYVIVVFDGLYTKGLSYSEKINDDFEVVYTAGGETADSYIEKIAYAKKNDRVNVYVVTSDGPEQNQILGAGAYRIPVRELVRGISESRLEEKQYAHDNTLTHSRNEMGSYVKSDIMEKLEKMRRQRH